MGSTAIQIPSRLPLLLTNEGVLLPGSSVRFSVETSRNIQLVKSRLLRGTSVKSTIIGVIPNTRDPDSESDELPHLHRIGTAGIAVQVVGSNWPKPHYTLLITGLCRFQIVEVLKEKPYPVAEVEQLDRLEQYTNGIGQLSDLSQQFYKYAVQLVEMLDISVPVVAKLRNLLDSLPKETLPDILAAIIRTSTNEKLQILDAVGLEERFKKTIPLLVRQIEGLKLLQKTRKSKPNDDKRIVAIRPFRRNNQVPGRPLYLDTVEEEDDDDDGDDIIMLEKKIKNTNMPEQAMKVCIKEIKRLKKMPQSMPEFALTRNYLELMVELPWNKSTTDRLDLRAARVLLDSDHYAMQKLKQRVLEYLAVRQLKNNLKGPILCFVGPPGVGKTSVGRSIAKTLGREFYRIALGGVCDQSDIRGHRRTYVGSMPGRIINGLKTVGVNNPVFLLDEVDKLGKSLQGDPAAALLEVLDPEQNHSFTDHYLNVSFDLSQVLFIATANTTATISPALLDRMELIQVPGYIQEEKIEISHRHLIPKQLELHGLTPQQIQIPKEATEGIISRYTREAGVRSLERKIGAICRAVAVKVAESQHKATNSSGTHVTEKEGKERVREETKSESINDATDLALPPEMPIVIDRHALKDILGPPIYEMEHHQSLATRIDIRCPLSHLGALKCHLRHNISARHAPAQILAHWWELQHRLVSWGTMERALHNRWRRWQRQRVPMVPAAGGLQGTRHMLSQGVMMCLWSHLRCSSCRKCGQVCGSIRECCMRLFFAWCPWWKSPRGA
ncbi:lon protease homolog 2, peroxisomal isoform X3 [Cetorhinus maximus]